SLDPRQQLLRAPHVGELAPELRETDLVHRLRWKRRAVQRLEVEGDAGVADHRDAEAEVAGHPRARADAVIGGEPRDHERVMTALSQERLEFGPDERAVDGL